MTEYEEKTISKQLERDGFKFLSGDINFITYNGSFYKKYDRESYNVIEIINANESLNSYPYDFIISLHSIYFDRKDRETKRIINQDKESLYYKGRHTTLMKIRALHDYGAYDRITSISGNELDKMIDWIIRADYHYPHIETYKENTQ